MAEKPRCDTCRNWFSQNDATGTCQRFTSSPSHTKPLAWPRIYPVGVAAWVETIGEFSCSQFERKTHHDG